MKINPLFVILAFLLLGGISSGCSHSDADTSTSAVAAPAASPSPNPNDSHTVWVNLSSHIYHRRGQRWYGATNYGQYMNVDDAIKAGYRPSRNGQ